MNILISGYYGFRNGGDEGVLAAILDHLEARLPAATVYTVTSGDAEYTERLHGTEKRRVRAIPRQSPGPLLQAIRACDLFISGGGSLLQDATSLRNVVYYSTLIRLARMFEKPVMIYGQG